MTYRKLYRSQYQKVIAGICGGLGIYFNIDPVIIRILFIIFCLLGGSGLLLYLIMWLIIPPEL